MYYTPISITPEIHPPPLTKLGFLRRFTQAERIAIADAQSTDAVIADAQTLFSLADYIDVADPDTVRYVHYLGEKGYLTSDRVATILATVAT